jgi:hypothetical protein
MVKFASECGHDSFVLENRAYKYYIFPPKYNNCLPGCLEYKRNYRYFVALRTPDKGWAFMSATSARLTLLKIKKPAVLLSWFSGTQYTGTQRIDQTK